MVRRWMPGALAALAAALTSACVSLPHEVRDQFECVADSVDHFGGEQCARE